MLVLAPAACITSGIALSEAFDVFTRSIKFQLPNILDNAPDVCPPCISLCLSPQFQFCDAMLVILGISFEHPTNVCCYDITFKAGDINSASSIAQNDASKIESHATTNKSETISKERPSRKNRKKEKEKEIVEKVPSKPENKKRLLVLPLEASAVSILLLIVLGGFYVVCHL